MIAHDCARHGRYLLSCDQWERLVIAAVACAACDTDAELVVDHDHSLGRWAVRGLVCRPCNNALRRIDRGRTAPPAHLATYLANPWHVAHLPRRIAVEHPPSTFDINERPFPAMGGTAELAQLLGVSRQRVAQLVETAGFPQPAITLSMGSIWVERDVRAWAERTGRDLHSGPDEGAR